MAIQKEVRAKTTVFRVRKIVEVDISTLERKEKINKINEIAKDENKRVYWNRKFIDNSDKLLVNEGEWIEEVEEPENVKMRVLR